MPLTRFLLLAGCWLAFRPATAQQPDSAVAHIKRQGFYVFAFQDAAPFLAVRAGGPFGPGTLMYYFDRDGHQLPGGPYQYRSHRFEEWRGYHHRAFAQKNGRFGVINSQGQVVVPFLFEAIEPSYHPAGWLKIWQTDRWGLVDSVGRVVVPPRYQEIQWFSDGMAAVKRDGRWGFLDAQGQERIPPTYRYVWEGGFHEGFAAVTPAHDSLHVGFINKRNVSHTGFPFEYPFCVNRFNAYFRDFTPYYQFSRGYALVRNGNCEVGAIDTLGRVLLPTRFYSIEATDSTLTGHRRKQRVVVRLPR